MRLYSGTKLSIKKLRHFLQHFLLDDMTQGEAERMKINRLAP